MDFMALALLLIGIAAGFGLGILRGKQQLAGAVSRKDYDALMQEKTAFEAKLDNALAERRSLEEKLETTRRELIETRERIVASDTNNRNLEQRYREQQQELDKMQERLKLEFKNAATGILEEIGTRFNAQSEKQMGDLLNPLKERLVDFQKLVGDSFSQQGKEQHTLKAEIEKIVLQTDGLAKALRGDVKAQGNWGEIMLERILEESGLRKDSDYILQGVDMGLTRTDGSRQQPDVVINLPDDKHIIIDAKVSLTAYERFSTEQDAVAKDVHLRDFLRSVKAHVNGLEARRYQDNEKLHSPDFVLMFMPIEGAYSLAIQQDRELHSYAWGKRIVIVCPSTLLATLKTVASLWSIERQNRHAQEIATKAGDMYDKLYGFVEEMTKVGDRLNQAQKSYDDAYKKLSTGRGNLISQAEKLKTYGVKTSKSLSKLIRNEDDAVSNEPEHETAES